MAKTMETYECITGAARCSDDNRFPSKAAEAKLKTPVDDECHA